MKKIKSIKQLQAEKKRMRIEQRELEEKIKFQWNEFKHYLHPSVLAKETFATVLHHKEEQIYKEDSILKSMLNFGISLLTKKLIDKAGKKLNLFAKHVKN